MQRVDEGFRLPSPVVCTLFFFLACIRQHEIRTINHKSCHKYHIHKDTYTIDQSLYVKILKVQLQYKLKNSEPAVYNRIGQGFAPLHIVHSC